MFCYKNSKSWQSDLWFVYNPFPSQKHLNCLDVLILAWNLLKHKESFFCQLSYALNIYAFSIFPIYIFTLIELFSGGKRKMRVYRGRVEGPASPLLHGAAGWGVMTPCQLTNGQCSYTFCIVLQNWRYLFSATTNIIIYVILALATSCPGQYVSQDSCNTLIKCPLYIYDPCL